MAGQPTYPGVYIEEVPSGVRTITGVATSIAAFVDGFARGPMNRAVQVFNVGDFEREFGGLDVRSEASYQVHQFFANGGTEAWVVRTASGNIRAANLQVRGGIGGTTALTVEAIDAGSWGNDLRMTVDYPAPVSDQRFNVTVLLTQRQGGNGLPLRTEVFRNLSMDPGDARYVESVLNDEASGSKLVRVSASGSTRPLQTGTLSGALAPPVTLTGGDPQLTVTIGSEGTGIARIGPVSGPMTLAELRERLETAIRSAQLGSRAFSEANVSVVDGRLRVLAGPGAPGTRVTFSPVAGDPTAGQLGLTAPSTVQGLLSADLAAALPPASTDLDITIGGVGPVGVSLTLANIVDIAGARAELEAAVRAADPAPAFTDARVVTHLEGGEERLIVLAGVPNAAVACGGAAAAELGLDAGVSEPILAHVSTDINPAPSIAGGSAIDVQVGGEGPHTATLAAAATLSEIAASLQGAVRAASGLAAFAQARVAAYEAGGEQRLVVLLGIAGEAVTFGPTAADATTVGELRLDAANAEANVQLYVLGAGPVNPAAPPSAQGSGEVGDDGDPPDADALIGAMTPKTGMHALEDVDLFNILCIPRAAVVSGADALSSTAANAVMSAAIGYCERRRAVFIVDPPNDVRSVSAVRSWLEATPGLRHRNAALYFPRVKIADPLDAFRLRAIGASGTMAGLYARTDGRRGVWKAPAGTEATLTNVQRLDYVLSDAENGALNPLGINCLRSFPVYGKVAWGARTLLGADQMASEWKYLPVRRTALFLQESLYRGTQWVVFEPNDEPLWAQIRLNVGAFMHNLFRQGAFQGTTPREAYLVKCDRETTTQNDIDLGIVNVLVGFAPLKPAEFVYIRIQQMAGQLEA